MPIPVRLVVALAALIAIGTALLLLPRMTTQPITFMDALFTSTSAAAVTGLGVVTTGTAFTRLGQWVILLLMQLGGLGFLVAVDPDRAPAGTPGVAPRSPGRQFVAWTGQHPGDLAGPRAHHRADAGGRRRSAH